MKYLKVSGHENLARDIETGAILNLDIDSYKSYMKLKEIKLREEQRVSNLETQIDTLKGDLNEIKHLLKEIVNGPK
jgi:formiminotetrahydrofolate cyclodeaminase